MKKLAHVLVLPKLAGSQQFCLNLLSCLTEYDRYVLVSSSEYISNHQKKEFISRFEAEGITIIWCKFLKRNIGLHDLKAMAELYRIFNKYNFDIVHCNSTKPGIIARIAARLAKVELIVHTVHGVSFYKSQSRLKRFSYWLIEMVAMQFGHVNVTVNKFYLKYYKYVFWKESVCIYNGMKFPDVQIDKLQLSSNNKKLLFVGRLDTQKDPLTLLKSFSILVNKYPGLTLDVVGDGELYNECRDFINIHNLQNCVNLHGWVDDPSSFYQNADIFVCPSIYEAFGFIFLEAAFFKLPIVSTNVEGIPEVVIDGEMGFLIEPNNYEMLANKIMVLLDDDTLSVTFGEKGHATVIEKFELKHMIDDYRDLYQNKMKVNV